MPKLHAIRFSHHAPRGREDGIKLYVIADDEEVILDRLDEREHCGCWAEATGDGETFDIYDDDYNVIGTETKRERLLRRRGEIDDECVDFSDAYYGVTCLGWDEGEDVTPEDAAVLIRLGIAEDWTKPAFVTELRVSLRELTEAGESYGSNALGADDIEHVATVPLEEHRWYVRKLDVYRRKADGALAGVVWDSPATEVQEDQDRNALVVEVEAFTSTSYRVRG